MADVRAHSLLSPVLVYNTDILRYLFYNRRLLTRYVSDSVPKAGWFPIVYGGHNFGAGSGILGLKRFAASVVAINAYVLMKIRAPCSRTQKSIKKVYQAGGFYVLDFYLNKRRIQENTQEYTAASGVDTVGAGPTCHGARGAPFPVSASKQPLQQ